MFRIEMKIVEDMPIKKKQKYIFDDTQSMFVRAREVKLQTLAEFESALEIAPSVIERNIVSQII